MDRVERSLAIAHRLQTYVQLASHIGALTASAQPVWTSVCPMIMGVLRVCRIDANSPASACLIATTAIQFRKCSAIFRCCRLPAAQVFAVGSRKYLATRKMGCSTAPKMLMSATRRPMAARLTNQFCAIMDFVSTQRITVQ